MRGVYVAEIKISALAASKTLILIEGPASQLIEILSAHVGQVGTNLTNQQLEIVITRVTTLGTPAGTAITPTLVEGNDQAFAGTVLGNLTAEPTTYATNHLDHQGVSSLGGYFLNDIPESRPDSAAGGSIGLRMLNTPTSADFVCQVKFQVRG